jgi:hypothetical protein
MKRLAPPSGAAPPAQAVVSDGKVVDLHELALQVCARYDAEFPDEAERYGPAGFDWCLHDNQYLLAWAIQDARDATVALSDQALWLADVLAARGYPIARLARDLEIATEIIRSTNILGSLGPRAAEVLTEAARAVAERDRATRKNVR